MERMNERGSSDEASVIRDHRRQWRSCLYVYPVVARRSRGLSIGVNLNPDKRCNFSCVYCQINRGIRRDLHEVELSFLADELHMALDEAVSGRIWHEKRFFQTPEPMRRINDIALSGDGEPTCLGNFDQAVRIAADVKDEMGLDAVKIVIITNATKLRSEAFGRALPILDAHNGEVWAKLDAGTDERFQCVNRPRGKVALREIVDNITAVAVDRPVVIQSLFFRLDGCPPPEQEVAAYCQRLAEITDAGGHIKLIQVHTIARPPASGAAATLPDDELDAIAERISAAAAPVPVEIHYGQDVKPQSA